MGAKKIITIMLAIMMVVVAGCGGGEKVTPKSGQDEILVAAAMSLRDVMEEIKEVYTRENGDVKITYNFASSGTLQKQIEQGAPVDLFISAGKPQMDALEKGGLLLEGTRVDLLENELVLIGAPDSSFETFEALAGNDVDKICIGTPETVPAGNYTKQILTSLDLWDAVKHKLVLAKDVRQVLTYVETGNVDAGVVFRTDAMTGKEIRIIAKAPPGTHKPAVYPMAVIKGSKNQKAATELAGFLAGETAAEIFEQHGFIHLQKNK